MCATCNPVLEFKVISKYSVLMWMFYSAQYWPEVTDLESGVKRLHCELTDYRFEADHEIVYNFDVALDETELQNMKQLVEEYSDGLEVCDLYLRKEISLECLLYEFKKLNLRRFLQSLKKFVPAELQDHFTGEGYGENSSEEEEAS